MRRLLTLAILTLMPILAWGDGYICAVDKVTGFKYTGKAWQSANFTPHEKFIVRHPTKDDSEVVSGKWAVLELGSDLPDLDCIYDFDEQGDLFCSGPFKDRRSIVEFRMNRKSFRFLYAYLAGYWDATPDHEAGNSPLVAIGKRSPM